ncbi:MAG: transketolase C-terminal domain-containing protein [Acidimicrobiia bacterium]|nr:transketolase C-terminal domain-containing protein [Acidimicrobiia bacterium]MDX2466126.1 transketolase C-terminal domain-containing protein [Acidimicrobiia bacterium]
MEIVKRPHVQNFIDWSKDKPEVVVLTADLTNSSEVGNWRDTYPDRFFPMKMAEQNMMGFASGLAREGYQPWIHTFAVFIYRRPYDQLAMSIAYPKLPVRFVAFLPGITTPGGVTHQAIEDVAIMRATPNMVILETGDATEVESVLDVAHSIDGPVYIRMLRGEVPRLFPKDEPMRLDKVRVLSEGDDVTVFTAGITTEEAIRAAAPLAAAGVGMTHLHVSTHKPFNDPVILESIRRAKHGVVTLENHTVIGGLGSAVAEVMAENAVGKRLVRLGLQDTYAHGASRQYLMKEYGLDAPALVKGIEDLLGRPIGITESDLEAVRIEQVHSLAKAEGL